MTRENARLERINQAQERESAELKKRVAELEESLLSLNQPRCSISSPCPKCGAHTETLKTQLDDLKADNNSLKASLKEHKQAMTHFAACYAFTLLAKCTPDGLVDFEGLSKYSTFAAYSRKVRERPFSFPLLEGFVSLFSPLKNKFWFRRIHVRLIYGMLSGA